MNKTAWFSFISWCLFVISIQWVIWRLFGIESTRIYFNQYPEIISLICTLLLPIFVLLWAMNSFNDTLKELHKKHESEENERAMIANYKEEIASLQNHIQWLLPKKEATEENQTSQS